MRAAAVAGGVAVLVLGGAVAAQAAWSDSATATSGTVSARILAAPVTTCTTVNVLLVSQATITWTAASSPAPLAYTATLVESGQSLTVSAAGDQRSTEVTAGLLSTVVGTDLTVRVRAALPGTSWTSVAVDEPVRLNLLGTSVSCVG